MGEGSEGIVNSGRQEASKQRDETELLQREAGADMYSGVMWFPGWAIDGLERGLVRITSAGSPGHEGGGQVRVGWFARLEGIDQSNHQDERRTTQTPFETVKRNQRQGPR